MQTVCSILLYIAVAIPAFFAAMFALEVFCAVLRRNEREVIISSCVRGAVVVLVPAHDEAAGLSSTLDQIVPQLAPGDRILVVADNCTDDTANIARRVGVEVIERNDDARRGKGYALDFGVSHLKSKPPSVVVFVDADCRVAPGAIEKLALCCTHMDRPVQGLDLMTAPDDAPHNLSIPVFAWRVNNLVRPLGLSALGMPCRLMGTGMAFPWRIIEKANLNTGHVVEDLKLSLDLAIAGEAPIFCRSAVVTSEFPRTAEAAQEQRARWEGGHIDIMKVAIPLIFRAMAHGQWRPLVLALDVAIPPLTLLLLWTSCTFVLSGMVMIGGGPALPFMISLMAMMVSVLGIFAAWRYFARDVFSVHDLTAIVPFLASKSRLYRDLVRLGRPSNWVRARR